MRRVLVIIALALLAFQTSGLAALCGDAACDDPCPTDLFGGQCPPNCHYCSCCSLPQAAAPASTVAMAVPEAKRVVRETANGRLPAVDPADILHVPKSLA